MCIPCTHVWFDAAKKSCVKRLSSDTQLNWTLDTRNHLLLYQLLSTDVKTLLFCTSFVNGSLHCDLLLRHRRQW